MLTYYFGRVGLTGRQVCVGHPSAALFQLQAGEAQAAAELAGAAHHKKRPAAGANGDGEQAAGTEVAYERLPLAVQRILVSLAE